MSSDGRGGQGGQGGSKVQERLSVSSEMVEKDSGGGKASRKEEAVPTKGMRNEEKDKKDNDQSTILF